MVDIKTVEKIGQTANQAGDEHKELFDKASKLTEAAAVRNLYENLVLKETGTIGVEKQAYKLVCDRNSKEGKNIDPNETVFTGRDPKVVVDMLNLKVKYAKKAEEVARAEYHKQWEVVENKIEKGTRRNRKLRDKLKQNQNKKWEELNDNYNAKIENLVKKFNAKKKVVKTAQEKEDDELLEGILMDIMKTQVRKK